MRAPVPVYLILSENVLHESLQKLILRFVAVAGLQAAGCATLNTEESHTEEKATHSSCWLGRWRWCDGQENGRDRRGTTALHRRPRPAG